MSNSLIQFDFNSHPIRTFSIENQPHFCLKDVCDVLELSNSRMILERLDPKGVSQIDTLTNGGIQKITFINESNLYRVIFRSDKPQAKDFQDWVFEEVLPAIRKTGSYSFEKAEYVRFLEEHAVLQNKYIALLEEKTAPKPKRPPPKRFTPEALAEIAKLKKEGCPPKQIAEQLGFGFSSLSLVLKGMSHEN